MFEEVIAGDAVALTIPTFTALAAIMIDEENWIGMLAKDVWENQREFTQDCIFATFKAMKTAINELEHPLSKWTASPDGASPPLIYQKYDLFKKVAVESLSAEASEHQFSFSLNLQEESGHSENVAFTIQCHDVKLMWLNDKIIFSKHTLKYFIDDGALIRQLSSLNQLSDHRRKELD